MGRIAITNGGDEGCGSRKPSSTRVVVQGAETTGQAQSYVGWISSNVESGLDVLRGPE